MTKCDERGCRNVERWWDTTGLKGKDVCKDCGRTVNTFVMPEVPKAVGTIKACMKCGRPVAVIKIPQLGDMKLNAICPDCDKPNDCPSGPDGGVCWCGDAIPSDPTKNHYGCRWRMDFDQITMKHIPGANCPDLVSKLTS